MAPFDFSTFPQLETDRLLLRRITPGDVDAWHALHRHPDVIRYLTDFEATPPREELEEIVAWADRIFAGQSGLRWALTLKPDPRLIGTCGFHLYEKAHRCAEIGYELHHDYWRQGIMSEALAVVLRFGFQQMNLHRIEANVTVGNDSSANLLRRHAFTLEGTWREKVYNRGRFHDLWQFSLLETEYRPDQPPAI